MPREYLLHRHIAIASDVETQYDDACKKAEGLLRTTQVFEGMTRTYEPLSAEDTVGLPPENKKVAATVPEILAKLEEAIARKAAFEFMKDEGNQRARADIVVDGVTLERDVPAQTLITMERLWRGVRKVLLLIPTLELTVEWEKSTVKDVFKSGPTKKNRTTKKTRGVVLHEGTDKHPPQVQAVTEDVVIGQFLTTTFSGAIPSHVKSALIERVDKLLKAIKQDREEANRVRVKNLAMRKSLQYVFAGEMPGDPVADPDHLPSD